MTLLWAAVAFAAGVFLGIAVQQNRKETTGTTLGLKPGTENKIMAAIDDLRAAITDYIAKVDVALATLNDGVAAFQAQLDSDEATDAAAIQPLLDQVKAVSDALPVPPPEVTEPPA